jgi:phosphate transport system substrate-binding protein
MNRTVSKFKKCGRGLVGLTIVLLVIAGCSPSSEKKPASQTQFVLKVSGSGTTTSVLNGVKPAFEAATPGYRLEIMPGAGTGGGVKGVTEGLLNVAAMARPPKDTETAQGLEYLEIGQSGIAIFVHPSVSVNNLTSKQVVAILTGKITNWAEVGGAKSEIALYVRDEEDSSTKAVRSVLLGKTPFAKTARTLTSQEEMQDSILKTPNSVGMGSWASARAAGVNIKAVAVDGVSPDSPTYTMLAPMGIGYLAARKADVQPLLDWLLSEPGKTALKTFGVIIK